MNIPMKTHKDLSVPMKAANAIHLLVASVLLSAFIPAVAQQYEGTQTFATSDILPPQLASGPNHRVRGAVVNDGFLNTYEIDSKFGHLTAVSSASLRQYIHELNAMASMETLKGSEEFKSGLKGAASGVAKGGMDLVAHPVDSASGAVSGVKSLFRSAGATISHGRSATEDGLLAQGLGFSAVKRQYAHAYQVDVYSRNPLLQDMLDDISRAGFLGSAVVRLGTAAVAGPAGAVLSVSKLNQSMSQMLRDKTPGDLRVLNAEALRRSGVSAEVADLFLENRNYTLTDQTAIAHALDLLGTTKNREGFVRSAVLSDSADIASFRRRQIELYLAYDHQVGQIVSFDYLGSLAVGRKADGGVVIIAPVDYLLWTSEFASFAQRATAGVDKLNAPSKELVLGGGISALAQKNIEALGWAVKTGVASQLGGS